MLYDVNKPIRGQIHSFQTHKKVKEVKVGSRLDDKFSSEEEQKPPKEASHGQVEDFVKTRKQKNTTEKLYLLCGNEQTEKWLVVSLLSSSLASGHMTWS